MAAVIEPRRKQMCFFDSFQSSGEQYLVALRRYLEDESRDKRKQELDWSQWRIVRARSVPRQTNGYDCGQFCMLFLNYAAEDVVCDGGG